MFVSECVCMCVCVCTLVCVCVSVCVCVFIVQTGSAIELHAECKHSRLICIAIGKSCTLHTHMITYIGNRFVIFWDTS